MLWYLPLEPYIERYTWFMSCQEGWTESHFNKYGVPFKRIEGETLGSTIDIGVVLDANNRCYYAMSQLCTLVKLLKIGHIKQGDTVYTEDFWHPGIESLFYCRQLSGIDFKIGTFLHAQTMDEHDFTFPMRTWMRPIEIGFGKGYDYIFVTSDILAGLCEEAGIAKEKIHVVGLPFNSHRLLQQLQDCGFSEKPKEPYVLFSSRFDREKDPMFFLNLVRFCPDIKFKLVKPRKEITNDLEVKDRLKEYLSICSNLEIIDTSNKLSYYQALSGAKVQFNCAHQDWVSWTLLEAVTFGCNPLYPYWRDFPKELDDDTTYLYNKGDLESAACKLRVLMNKPFDNRLKNIQIRHDNSWFEYLVIMGLL